MIKTRIDRKNAVLLLALAVYAAMVFFVAAHHEGWFDEAQAWLLARDLTPWDLVTHYTRYEGTPPLWSLLLMPFAKSGFPYSGLSFLSGSVAIAGIAIFLFRAPLPRWVRILFPFCYIPLFQFAEVARSYVLFIPLLFAIATIYRSRVGAHPILYSALVALLAIVSAHGVLLAAVLVLDWFWTAWSDGLFAAKPSLVFGVGASFVLLSLLLFLELRVPADLLPRLRADFVPSHMALRVAKQVSEAFWGGMGGTFYDAFSAVFGLSVLTVSLYWMRSSRAAVLLTMMSGALLLLALRQAAKWHSGILFLVWIFSIWIFFDERPKKPEADRRLICAMAAVFAVQIWFGLESMWFDEASPYSGSRDAAKYLSGTGEDRKRLYAVGFKSFALQPYFRKSLFADQERGRRQAFYSWTEALDHEKFEDIDQQKPDKVIIGMSSSVDYRNVAKVAAHGYCLEKQFNASLWWKNARMEADSYAVMTRCR